MDFRLSTDDVDDKARLDYWQHVCSELIGLQELHDYDSANFYSHIDMTTVGDVRIGHFTGVSQTLQRNYSSMKSGDSDDYVVLLESDGLFEFDHHGRQRSGRNGIVLIDISQPYATRHPEGMNVTDFFVPRLLLEGIFEPIRRAAALTIEPDQASYPILSAFLRSLQQHGSALDAAKAEHMSLVALDLIAAGFAEKMGQLPSQELHGATIVWRAQSYIADRIAHTGLGMEDIAEALGLSLRRLHQIASKEGLSLMDWMWERRLQRARDLLANPMIRCVQIGLIAYQCGFVDQAHFSRRFKERFGLSPREFRRSAPAGPASPPVERT